jgi:hypothetical protein
MRQANGSYTGTATFGRQPPPPPPDPSVGYLPGVDLFDAGPAASTLVGRWGFVFTLQNVTFDGVRLQFEVNAPNDMWSSWCAAQQPIYSGFGSTYYCTPAVEFISGDGTVFAQDGGTLGTVQGVDGGGTITLDLIKYILCEPPDTELGQPGTPNSFPPLAFMCRCDATACSVSSNPVRFDMQLGARRIDGSSTLGAAHFVPAQ